MGLGVNTYGDKLVLKERGESNGRDGLALSTTRNTRTDMRRERAVRGALLPHLNESKDKSDR